MNLHNKAKATALNRRTEMITMADRIWHALAWDAASDRSPNEHATPNETTTDSRPETSSLN